MRLREVKQTLISVQRFLLLWVVLVALSLTVNVASTRDQVYELAKDRARTIFSFIELTRLWNAGHGGLYVPITEKNQPNPYLDVRDRDIVTVDGLRLTKINPAYMTRQISELTTTEMGVQFHMTSQTPIRPQNSADDWEFKALQNFKSGQIKEVAEIVEGKSGSVFRYMAPLITKEPCLACHQKQGYQLGDIRGGISVNITIKQFEQLKWEQYRPIIVMHLFIMAMGGIFILYFKRYKRSRDDAELAYIDALTGINNRRSFEKHLEGEWGRAKRRKEPLSIIMIDIDYFKNYNDSHGHQMGDQCLIDVATLLNNVLKRPGDMLARYGGEEFIVILEAGHEGAVQIAGEMRSVIEAAHIENRGSPVARDLTISLGVASDIPSPKFYPDELIARADNALYEAKKSGRNRVVF